MEGESVGTAAIAARVALPGFVARPHEAACDLSFDEPGGPLVAVCGLAGGVGTSTLALALARQAAAESRAPVLLADAAATPGLVPLAGTRSTFSLDSLAVALADGDQPDDPFAELAPGLRLIAAEPRLGSVASHKAMTDLLAQAQEAHGLVVVDCGTAWLTHADVLANANRVVWTMTTTALGLRAATGLVASTLMPRERRHEVLVARHVPGAVPAKVRAVRRLARERRSRLVLLAHEAQGAHHDPPGEPMRRALAAIAPTLRRTDQ